MSITSKVRQSVVLTADGQVQALVAGSAANITKANIMTIYGQATAADAEIKLYNEIGDAKTASALIFHVQMYLMQLLFRDEWMNLLL